MSLSNRSGPVRRKAVWGPKRFTLALLLAALAMAPSAAASSGNSGHGSSSSGKGSNSGHGSSSSGKGSGKLSSGKGSGSSAAKARGRKLDAELVRRSNHPLGTTSVIVRLVPGAGVPSQFKRFLKPDGRLNIINGRVLELPNRLLRQLEQHSEVFLIDYDRPTESTNYRTTATVGSRAVNRGFGLTGAGVGVAVIDSGITSWHDDLTNSTSTYFPYGNQRVAAFVDFVNGRTLPYDDEGHGTHVAGIIAGNGYDSKGRHAGVAPDATLVSLKVLDANGRGSISRIIAALDWVLANRGAYNIRVVNLSVGANVIDSYSIDPLTLAAKRVVDAGVVVVTTAGNRGKDSEGRTVYGAITAPGNAPWVVTVGASSTNGTVDRSDDTVASFSSRGPTYIDNIAKPDIVAPGTGVISLAEPAGTTYALKSQYLLDGVLPTAYKPYLTLSGTSMAAPVVAGTAALMLQANPSLTPNAVKAILQYTAQESPALDAFTQGAGFLNTVGALRLARFYATAQPGQPFPSQSLWSKKIHWGNHRITGGVIVPTTSAYRLGTAWGGEAAWGGDNIVWGTWGADNIVWGTFGGHDNIVWGTDCGGFDCADNIVWGTWGFDNIVWGTAEGIENIAWSAWGADNIVWGTWGADNIVWGTAIDENVAWGTWIDDNIVWGTDANGNVIWGTAAESGVAWVAGSNAVDHLNWSKLLQRLTDAELFEKLAQVSKATAKPAPTSTTSTTTSTTSTLLSTTSKLLGGL